LSVHNAIENIKVQLASERKATPHSYPQNRMHLLERCCFHCKQCLFVSKRTCVFTSAAKLREHWPPGGRVSVRTVTRRLHNAHLRARRPVKRPYVSPHHLQARLQWANDHLRWNIRNVVSTSRLALNCTAICLEVIPVSDIPIVRLRLAILSFKLIKVNIYL
jgi:hypothetical protein